jgi:hypothetical protein
MTEHDPYFLRKMEAIILFRTIITFKPGLSASVLSGLCETAEKAFDNRAGRAVNSGKNPLQCIFEGDDELNTCLHLGNYALDGTKDFKNYVKSWDWIDTVEPDESHDVLEAYAEIAVMRAR